MEKSSIFIDETINLKLWNFPESIKITKFSSPEHIDANSLAVIICPEKAKKLGKEFFLTHRVIIDHCEKEFTKQEIRELCLKTPFYIILENKDRNIEEIFKRNKIPLKHYEKKNFMGIVFQSEKMEKIISLVKKVAKTDATVLIRGESGTGKELIAKAIHNLSNRKEKPFIAVNCASIPETLLEAELFGHKKGAFTDAYTDRKGKFEQANGGTIFLDEIGDMPLSLQAKILRVLQEKEITPLGSNKNTKVDVRVLSATSRNLEEMIKNGEFREDIYYRLNVIPINLPPLRERKEDIPLLADYFLTKSSLKHNIPKPVITDNAIDFLKDMIWKGNIRELENFIEKLIVFNAGKKEISKQDIENALKDF